MNQTAKSILRKKVIEQRSFLSTDTKLLWEQQIQSHLLLHFDIFSFSCFFFYISTKDEIDTKPLLLDLISQKKIIALPKVNGNALNFYQIPSGDFDIFLTRGAFGILEPNSQCLPIDIAKAQIIFVPGLAFDTSGYRLGYGKGFYDRFLSQCSKQHSLLKIAFAYEFQIVAELPREPHDQQLDFIITEKRVIRCIHS